MKIRVNEQFALLEENYLFSETGHRTRAYQAAHPEKKVLRLGIGDVTLPLAPCVAEAMRKAVDEMGVKETFRGYSPEYGYDFLREKLAARYRRFGVRLPAEEIYVSDGAKSDVGSIVDILGENEVLLPDPVYPVYRDSNLMCGRRVRFLPAGRENDFLPMPEGLLREPYVIYLCSPNNPTGAAYSRAQLRAWVDFALESGSLIVFDAAYEAFVEGDFPHSIYEIPGAEACAVEIGSFSKTAGFTGVRCAWAVFPEALENRGVGLGALWRRRQATRFNGVGYIVQRGAEAALSEAGERQCMEAVAYYKRNVRLLSQVLVERGIYHTGGLHSPYLWFACPEGERSWEFFDRLLATVQVVGTPGAGFGKRGEGYFRLTGFSDRASIEEAAERLKTVL